MHVKRPLWLEPSTPESVVHLGLELGKPGRGGWLRSTSLLALSVLMTGLLLAGCGGTGSGSAVTAPQTAAPTGLDTSGAGTNQLTISWQPVSGATSYNLYWSSTSGVGTGTGIKVANVTSPYTHSGLAANSTFYYVVTAVGGSGESPASSQASGSTAALPTSAPPVPVANAATGGTNQVTVTWSPNAGATSYNIYWTNDPTHVMKDMGATKIANVTSPFRHTRLDSASIYAYVVTAVNAAGESAESEVVSASTATLDGVSLYNAKCGTCHNPLDISEKKGRTALQIQGAINLNRGGMGSLSTLTAPDVQGIADVLGF